MDLAPEVDDDVRVILRVLTPAFKAAALRRGYSDSASFATSLIEWKRYEEKFGIPAEALKGIFRRSLLKSRLLNEKDPHGRRLYHRHRPEA